MTLDILELQSFDVKDFLRTYWQKKPCVLRQAVKNFETIVTPDELAGLACEEGVDSRVITGHMAAQNWTLQDGPFDDEFFSSFPDKNSTLLVQRVDSLVPEVAQLRSLFSFLPSWRFDDVMISFAEDQGSVGPHLDNYDVFLLQGMGKRHWQVGGQAILEEEDLVQDCPVRVLKEFHPEHEWTLDVGDILYLPPRWAHHGVSLGRGMTYSFGFRSPAISDMLLGMGEHSLRQLSEKDRYTDSDLSQMDEPLRIDDVLVQRVKKQLITAIQGDAHSHLWLGRLMTSNPNVPNDEDLHEYQQMGKDEALHFINGNKGVLERIEDVKCMYHCGSDGVHFYIHGHEFILPVEDKDFVKTLVSQESVELKDLAEFLHDAPLRKENLSEWIHRGYFRCS